MATICFTGQLSAGALHCGLTSLAARSTCAPATTADRAPMTHSGPRTTDWRRISPVNLGIAGPVGLPTGVVGGAKRTDGGTTTEPTLGMNLTRYLDTRLTT